MSPTHLRRRKIMVMYKRFHKTEMRWKGWKLTTARLKVRQPEIKKPNTKERNREKRKSEDRVCREIKI